MKKRKEETMKIKYLLGTIFVAVLVTSCNPTKYLAEGEKFYTGGDVVIHHDSMSQENKEAFEKSLEESLLPKPNSKLLGVYYKVGLWNMGGGPDSTNNFIRKWLKRNGQEPVKLGDVNREYNENLLRGKMENLGFFNAQVSSDTLIKEKYASVRYDAYPGKIYRINKVVFDVDTTTNLGWRIHYPSNRSLLKPGNNYNLDVILNERDRIDDDLKHNGFYYFSPDNILVEVDSTIGDHKVDMYVTVKPETPAKAREPQYIGNVYIFADYRETSSTNRRRIPRNTEKFDDKYYIVDPLKKHRKKVLANHIFMNPGEKYSRWNHNQTINHLVNLNAYKFVKNDFVDNPDSTNHLDVYYYLTPLPSRSIRLELIGKTAAVYNGTEVTANWTLRNAFKGFETLNLSVFGGYETQTGGNVNLNSSYIRYGAEVGITWPRLLSPWKWAPVRRYIPKTFLKAGYEFLNRRTAYTLNSMTLNYGYAWKENEQRDHNLTLAEIIYVQPRGISDEYRAQMDTVPTLRHIVDPQFSFGPNYVFTFTNTMDNHKKHTFYAKAGLNTSGNILGLIQGADYNSGKIKHIFGTPYSQFIKAEADMRHYLKLSTNSTLASRLMIGTSYSYGNSRSLPYLKQYYTGGPNGLRAFRARAVGPGSSLPENIGEENFFADQTGDFKLEMNTEYRAKIAGMLHWAAFIDAGNVWLQNKDDNKPGGKLSGKFLSELAVGGGVGLRLDLDFLIVRTDFAIPFRVPYRPTNDRWVFKYIDIRDRDWRRDNLVFNLAIGYPF
ncbi:BamA/TamA family outer membrane protein [Sphingobacterium lactis]|uniref:translocation and assembly module lipoprotein TamL n=1 Tax=Sphingobacterium lactis TaxID=797291 RepID=UPI003F7EE664